MDDPLAEWVARAREGDQDAFAEIVRATQTQVYNLAYQIVGNPQEAEDLVQQSYLRAWRALPTFRGEAKLTTWLYRITTNTCLNRRRRLGRYVDVDEEALCLLPDPGALPEERVQRRLERQDLWEAVGNLPEKYRTVLTLFYHSQLSYQDIASLLSLPLGTVKAQLNRARHALAGLLKEDAAYE